jgi:hypothetical protein
VTKIKIEGLKVSEILELPKEYFSKLVLIDKPIIINIGSAEVLGQFAVKENSLIVELAQIDGGGEGILPTIAKIVKHIANLYDLDRIEYVVHAINCAQPNLKLRAHLEKTGFTIRDVSGKGRVYFKEVGIVAEPKSGF